MAQNIVDSGNRRSFASGAVRDIQSGKGRCDLLPIDVLSPLMDTAETSDVMSSIGLYMTSGNCEYLYQAIKLFTDVVGWSTSECLLEVAIHYEDGAAKYGDRNWEKGILLNSFIDSGVRHYLKYLRGDIDERHDRAFVWNMLGAIWTHKHHPNLVNIPFDILNAGIVKKDVVLDSPGIATTISRDELSKLINGQVTGTS